MADQHVAWDAMTIPAMVERSCALFGPREAIVAGSRRLTYAELLPAVRKVANALLRSGVEPGDKIGLWLPNVVEWPLVNLAAASVGAITVPINTRFKQQEARYVLRSADVKVLFTTDRFLTNNYLEMLRTIAPDLGDLSQREAASEHLPALRKVITLDDPAGLTLSWHDFLATGSPERTAELARRLDDLRPEAPVTMFWTSGTTADPKGALAPHRVLANVANYADILGYTERDRCLASAPMFYTTTNYWVFLVSLMTGACCVMSQQLTPEETLALLGSEHISVMIGMPNMFTSLLAHPDFPAVSTDAMRCVWLGGATVSQRLVADLIERMGLERISQVYGMTETGGITTMTPPGLDPVVVAASVGRPMPQFELRIVDEGGSDVATGESGQLLVRSPYNLTTYYGMPKEQLDKIISADGWFATGDVFSRDAEGCYYFRGRTKDMIKSGGENVAARDVETVLLSHPGVRQVAVIGVPDEARNEAIVAYIERQDDSTEDDLREFCKQNLAPFKRPRSYVFCNDWPLTATGKIQKFRLVEDYLQQAAASR